MKPKGKRTQTIPFQFGGEYRAGNDATLVPDGQSRSLRNYVVRPGPRLDGRAPFVGESLDTVNGFAVWKDLTNELTKTYALRSADNKLYPKSTGGTGYGAGISGLPASTRLSSYANMQGKLYMLFSDGSGVPNAAAVWDGTTLSTTPFNSTINARALVSYIERLFLVDPRVTISPLGSFVTTDTYDWTSTRVQRTNVTASLITLSNGYKVCRLSPTSTAVSGCSLYVLGSAVLLVGPIVLAASASEQIVTWRFDSRGVDPFYDVPITLEWVLTNTVGTTTAYVVGDVMTPGPANNYRYRCIVAGTTAGAPPAYTTTIGATTVDGTVTWLNEGPDVVGRYEDTVRNITAAPEYTTKWLQAHISPHTNTITVYPRLKFYNSTYTALTTLAPIDISLKDGIADGDPRKRNYGQQWTMGDFYYPFYNCETATSATQNIDALIWSQIGAPKQILASSTYPLTEFAGLSTAATVNNGRLVVFKRNGMWIFRGQADINEPVLPETDAIAVGCIGPLAHAATKDNVLYWLSEEHVCRMKIGSDPYPEFIDAPGMFEEVMNKNASTWVEKQSTYNAPLLAIDHTNNDVWIYTQKGTIYVYHIATNEWSHFDTNPGSTSAEVAAMIYDPMGSRMLVAFGGQNATRFDETSDNYDTILTAGTTWAIANDIISKPLELFAARFEATFDHLGLFHAATIQDGSLTLSYSYDRGANFTTPSGYPATTWLTAQRIPLPVAATGPSVTIKLSRTGKGGSRNWSVTKADATLRVHRGELPYVNAT